MIRQGNENTKTLFRGAGGQPEMRILFARWPRVKFCEVIECVLLKQSQSTVCLFVQATRLHNISESVLWIGCTAVAVLCGIKCETNDVHM